MQVGGDDDPEADQNSCVVFCGSITITESGIYPILECLPLWHHCRAAPARKVQAALVACLTAMYERPSTMESLQITHLLQAWFIEVLGLAVETDVPLRGSWAGMQDRQLAPALRAIHEQPGTDWSVSQLATLAGLSRPRFAARFADVVGETPLRYLNRWRVECAAKRLLAGDTVTRSAQAVGFANAATFAKVFRRYRNSSPKEWLRALESQSPTPGFAAIS
jgi:AraC-like DNA-binding protein